jgi:Flp pilus assembly protein TadD
MNAATPTDRIAAGIKLAAILLATAGLGGCATMLQGNSSQSVADKPVTGSDERATSDAAASGAISESAEEARKLAAEAFAEGDWDTALYMFVQAVNLDPEDSHSLYAIGAIHENRGNMELAARAYQGVVAIDPSHALAQQQLGAAQLRAKDLEAAKLSLGTALQTDPTLWRAHNLLGVIADMEERYDDAIQHYSTAISLQPEIASIVNNRGYSKYLAGMLDAAEADFLRALEIDPSYDRAWKNIGLIHARRHEYAEARRVMERVVPKHVAANDVGYVAMLNADYTMAGSLFEEAIRISPRYYPTAAKNLAELRRRQTPQPVLATVESSGEETTDSLANDDVEAIGSIASSGK